MNITCIAWPLQEVKVTSPDYKGVNTDKAVDDFKQRIHHYERAYQPLDEAYDKDFSFIKIFNQGCKFLVNKVQGHVQSRVVYYLMNIHVLPRTIYLTRVSERNATTMLFVFTRHALCSIPTIKPLI